MGPYHKRDNFDEMGPYHKRDKLPKLVWEVGDLNELIST